MTYKKYAYECEACGQKTTVMRWNTDPVADCPCGGRLHESSLSWERNRGVVDDTVIGGRICETLGHEPFYYDSQSQLRREAERRGLVNVVRHDDHYYVTQRKQHMERLKDTGSPYDRSERQPARGPMQG